MSTVTPDRYHSFVNDFPNAVRYVFFSYCSMSNLEKIANVSQLLHVDVEVHHRESAYAKKIGAIIGNPHMSWTEIFTYKPQDPDLIKSRAEVFKIIGRIRMFGIVPPNLQHKYDSDYELSEDDSPRDKGKK